MDTYTYEIWGRSTRLMSGTTQAETEEQAYEEASIAAAENDLANQTHEIILQKEVDAMKK